MDTQSSAAARDVAHSLAARGLNGVTRGQMQCSAKAVFLAAIRAERLLCDAAKICSDYAPAAAAAREAAAAARSKDMEVCRAALDELCEKVGDVE